MNLIKPNKFSQSEKNMGKRICQWYNVCPMKRFYEQGKLDRKWVEKYCFRNGKNCKRREMEEKGIPHSDNMLPNGEIDDSLE